MGNVQIMRSIYNTGPEHLGGKNYIELVVRDSRQKIVGYALCESVEEAAQTTQEFEEDFRN